MVQAEQVDEQAAAVLMMTALQYLPCHCNLKHVVRPCREEIVCSIEGTGQFGRMNRYRGHRLRMS